MGLWYLLIQSMVPEQLDRLKKLGFNNLKLLSVPKIEIKIYRRNPRKNFVGNQNNWVVYWESRKFNISELEESILFAKSYLKGEMGLNLFRNVIMVTNQQNLQGRDECQMIPINSFGNRNICKDYIVSHVYLYLV